jgi:hypothetical protein
MPAAEAIVKMSRIALNLIADDYPGGGIEAPGLAPGQLGKEIYLTREEATLLSSTTIGVLYEGTYKYVKSKTTVTTAVSRGLGLRWSDKANFEVTVDAVGEPDVGNICGVALSTPGAGKYFWMFIGDGQVVCKFKATQTKEPSFAGDAVIAGADADNGLFDILADASAVTFGTAATKLSRWVGRLMEPVGTTTADEAIVELGLGPLR